MIGNIREEIEELQFQANINSLRSENENISIDDLSNDSKDIRGSVNN